MIDTNLIRTRYDVLLREQERRHLDRMAALCDLLDSWPLARRSGCGAVCEVLRREQRRAQSQLLSRMYRQLGQPLIAAAMRAGFRRVA